MATQKQLDLVRKLLALGESPFLPEAKEAQKKAAELIIKYDVRPHDLVEVPPPPQRRCPGCSNCQPRGGVIIRMYAWWSVDSGTTTTGASNG
jgi:hypothetical protein